MAAQATTGVSGRRGLAWVAAFLAYPAGGIAGAAVSVAAGPIAGAALAAAIIGAVQGAVLGVYTGRRTALVWIGGSAIAGGIGWAVAHALVPSTSGPASAAIVGGISGLAIGIAQAVATSGRGALRAVWVPLFTVAWAAGNAVSTAIGVDTDAWPVFGSAGAITAQVILLAGLVTSRRTASASEAGA
ncbi:MAG: hypothetical protein U0838_12395 [Chloroflexota bacterium]